MGESVAAGSNRILNIILTPLLTATLSGFVVHFTVRNYDEFQQQSIDQQRADLQGFWVIQTQTLNTTFAKYKGLVITSTATLTVDSSFNIHGVAYKLKERTQEEEHRYPREERARSTITGSVIREHIILNWESLDSTGRPSIQTFGGTIQSHNKRLRIQGNFFNDVASQLGTFCAEKAQLDALDNDNVSQLVECK